MKKLFCPLLSFLLISSLCGCSKSENTVSGASQASSVFSEIADPFASGGAVSTDAVFGSVNSAPSGNSESTASSGANVGDGYDKWRDEAPDLFTEDYIDYMKHSNTGMGYSDWQFRTDGENCRENDVITYGGGEMEISFTGEGFSEAGERSDGFMVFIGGTPQIVSVNGSAASTLAVDTIKDGETKSYSIKFTPRLTAENIRDKDNLVLTFIDMDEPLFLTAGTAEEIDYEHFISARQYEFRLSDNCDTTALSSNKSFEQFNETDPAVNKYMSRGALEYLAEKDGVYFDLFSAKNDKKPVVEDGKAEIALLLYGGKQRYGKFKVFFYVNHEQVKIDGCDYISAELKEGSVAKYAFTLDNVKEKDFVYAIAVSEGDCSLPPEQMTMKTDTRRLFAAKT